MKQASHKRVEEPSKKRLSWQVFLAYLYIYIYTYFPHRAWSHKQARRANWEMEQNSLEKVSTAMRGGAKTIQSNRSRRQMLIKNVANVCAICSHSFTPVGGIIYIIRWLKSRTVFQLLVYVRFLFHRCFSLSLSLLRLCGFVIFTEQFPNCSLILISCLIKAKTIQCALFNLL